MRSRIAMATGPAIVTLAVTIARLVAELNHAPAWLASSAPGGERAVLGIVWLPILFGPWFARQIAPAFATAGARVKRLMSTLVVYGYLARVPVFLLFFVDRHFGWNTHYAATRTGSTPDFWKQAAAIGASQLILWPLVWTLGVGTIAGFLFLLLRRTAVEPA
jgi:hypothetical protein